MMGRSFFKIQCESRLARSLYRRRGPRAVGPGRYPRRPTGSLPIGPASAPVTDVVVEVLVEDEPPKVRRTTTTSTRRLADEGPVVRTRGRVEPQPSIEAVWPAMSKPCEPR